MATAGYASTDPYAQQGQSGGYYDPNAATTTTTDPNPQSDPNAAYYQYYQQQAAAAAAAAQTQETHPAATEPAAAPAATQPAYTGYTGYTAPAAQPTQPAATPAATQPAYTGYTAGGYTQPAAATTQAYAQPAATTPQYHQPAATPVLPATATAYQYQQPAATQPAATPTVPAAVPTYSQPAAAPAATTPAYSQPAAAAAATTPAPAAATPAPAAAAAQQLAPSGGMIGGIAYNPYYYKVVLLGEGGVGKSALTCMIVQNMFIHDYDPTIENSYKKQLDVDGRLVTIDILDTAGQEEYVAMRDQHIRRGQGFILVYSIVQRSTFANVSQIHNQILRVKDDDKVPCVLVGNKCDLEDVRVVQTSEGVSLASQLGMKAIETSVKNRINVTEAFSLIVREIDRVAWEMHNAGNGPATPAATTGGTTQKKKRRCTIL